MIYEDCFAYMSTSGKCSALSEINCDGCKFYKSRDDITKAEIEADILKYKMK